LVDAYDQAVNVAGGDRESSGLKPAKYRPGRALVERVSRHRPCTGALYGVTVKPELAGVAACVPVTPSICPTGGQRRRGASAVLKLAVLGSRGRRYSG
jgi:hypothetical protein